MLDTLYMYSFLYNRHPNKTFAYRTDWYKQGFLHTAGHVKSHDQWSRRYVGSEHTSHGRKYMEHESSRWNNNNFYPKSHARNRSAVEKKNKTFERAI